MNQCRFSKCRTYRYELVHDLGDSPFANAIVFVMLNPSTADEQKMDPTVRRCVGYAERWGYGQLIVANLYALRSTDPKGLWRETDPVGPLNDTTLARLAVEYPHIVCAWGANAKPERAQHVYELMTGMDRRARLWCLGTTKSGAPKHPLYLRRDAELIPWSPPNSSQAKVRYGSGRLSGEGAVPAELRDSSAVKHAAPTNFGRQGGFDIDPIFPSKGGTSSES